MLGDPDAWGDPEQRTSMMKILAEVSVEMADLDATVVTVHPADSVPSQVDHSNARKLEVFHSSKRVDSRVMVAIEERIGTRPCYIGWGVPTFEGFADAMGAALDSRAKGLAIGRTWRVKGRGEAGDFGARLGEALRRCAADHPDRLLRLAERTTRIA